MSFSFQARNNCLCWCILRKEASLRIMCYSTVQNTVHRSAHRWQCFGRVVILILLQEVQQYSPMHAVYCDTPTLSRRQVRGVGVVSQSPPTGPKHHTLSPPREPLRGHETHVLRILPGRGLAHRPDDVLRPRRGRRIHNGPHVLSLLPHTRRCRQQSAVKPPITLKPRLLPPREKGGHQKIV